jgi:hypothetical protein
MRELLRFEIGRNLKGPAILPRVILYIALEKFQIKDIAKLLKYGFTSGFNMNYPVPRLPLDTKKLKCVLQYQTWIIQ